MDGGFETQTAGTPATSSSIATGVQRSDWTVNNASGSATISASGGRSGPSYITFGATASRRLQSPTAANGAVVNATQYVVQYFYKTSGGTAASNGQVGNSPDGTAQPGTYGAVTLTGTSGTWTKKTTVQTSGSSAASPKYGITILRYSAASGVDADFDDVVVYAGAAADTTAPNSPGAVTVNNPSGSTLDVSWGAASGGVDGGGYVVVRFASNPGASDDPNQNGIYAVGNAVTGSGVVRYIGTGTSFTDTGLSGGATYYYKVYTVDKAFNYSAETQNSGTTTASASAPSVSTVPASATNTTTATANGNVTADGGATVNDRGVCYKTTAGVTLADNKTASGSGTGTFSVNLSSLSVNQQYFFKAYATNTAGATLGSELTFTTLANVPGTPTLGNASSSSLDLTLAVNGNPAATEFAILCTNSSQYVQSSGALGGSAVWQTAATWGTKTVTGLSSSQEYGFQVKARNGENVETAFGVVGNGTTSAGAPTPTAPAVSTPTSTAIGTTTATLGGTIDSTNNAPVTARGIYWSTSSGFTPPGQGTVVSESGTFGNGAFSVSASGLPSGSTIYFKAYAENSAGAGYSAQSSFNTVPQAPAVAAASAITAYSLQANWGTATGSTNFLVDVATDAGFTSYVPGFTSLVAGNVLSVSVTGLSPAVSYYYRVRTQAPGGTSTNSATQSTASIATTATVSTASISGIGTTSATGGGTVSSDGGASVTARGACWNTSGTPTTSDNTTSDGSGTGAFVSSLTGLTPGRTYYVRAYAVNSAGTSYGAQVQFTADCPAGSPTGIHAATTNASSITAAWDAFSGAVSYRLDVSTSATYAAASAVATYQTGFEDGSKGSYTAGNVTLSGISWNLSDTLIGTTAGSDRFNGSKSARVRNSGSVTMQADTNQGLSSITFVHAKYSTDANTSGRVEYSSDSGASWSTAGTFTVSSTSLTSFEATNLNVTGNVRIRILKTDGLGDRFSLDDITLHPYTLQPSFIAGYSNRTVAGTSESVTGLTQGVTYYMRVRGESAYCTSANSTNGSVTMPISTPFANFGAASSSAIEGDGSVTVPVQISFAADATVNVAVAGSSTAAAGSDFTLASTQVVFTAAGATQENLTVALVADAVVESTETLVLSITGGPAVVPSGVTNHTVTINDDEPSVQFTYSSTTAVESAGTVAVTVYKSSVLNNVSGQFLLSGGAADPGDYTISGTNFTLNGATTSATITVTLTGDSTAELTDFLTLTLTNLVGASTGATAQATLIIEDDDSPALNRGDIAIVGFHMDDNDDFAFVALTNLPEYAVVKFTDKGWDGGAITGNEGSVEWMAPAGGVAMGTVVVVSNFASTGSVFVRGYSLSTSGDQLLAYQGTESAPTFIYALNDRLAAWQGSVAGTSDSMLPSGLTNGLTAVALTEADNGAYGGATTGDRQTLLSAISTPANWSMSDTRGTITLPAGPFTITGPQPEIAVLGVNLAVIASGDVTPATADGTDFGSAALVGVQVDHVFTITNTGSASLTLGVPSIGGVGATQFSLQTSPAGTLAAGASTTFTVRFDPAATGVHTASVSIANDDADENPYTFALVGTGAFGPAVSFGVAATSGAEGGSSVAIPLNIASTYDATVQVAVASGTATLTTDYTLSATQFVFAAGGATGATLSVSIVDDASIEASETVVLQIVTTLGGVTGSPSAVTLTITDNDAAAPLYAGDVAIIGRRKSDETFALMALTNLVAGQTVYFTDNGWASTNYRGSVSTSGDMAGNEDLLKLTINQTVSRGTIIRTTDTGDSRWSWVSSGPIPGPGSGSFSTLLLPDSNAEQIYAFVGDTANPLANFSTHLFVLDDSNGFEPATTANNGDIPPGLSSNAGTAVSFAYSATDLMALDMSKVLATSFVNKVDALAFIANVANWTSSGTLPSGVATFGLTCDSGLRPQLVSTHAIAVNAGSNVSFTVSANDPTCVAPSLTASNLPSGATFSPSVSGTNRSGTFSWTPSVGNTGVTLVVFFSSDGTLTTQRTVRINVGTASEAWSGGTPSSLVNWTVPVTNLLAASSGNATVQWVAVTGVIYQVYSTESTPGAGSTPWTLVGTVTGGASAASFAATGGTTQRFYQVVLAGDSPSTNGIWGVVRPTLLAGFNFFGAPLSGDRALNGEFGASLAAAMTGDPNGVGTPPGDELHVYQPGTGWLSFYLNGGVWYESGGAVATSILEPGVGVLLLRNGSTAQPVFTGTVGNRGTSTNTISAGWNIVALSEGRALPIASAFDNDAQGTPTGDYDETLADIVAIHNPTTGSWRRLQRLPTGQWMDLQTFVIVSNLYLLPGQAVYYYRQDGDLKVRF